MITFDKEGLESFHKAGGMVSKLRGEVPSLVKPGKPALEICEAVEARIRALGGKPAFPVGIGINDVAAHYT
ncbi:M24 family metallopeptidase, partial [Candidatus Bathyarchaeota archaeon]